MEISIILNNLTEACRMNGDVKNAALAIGLYGHAALAAGATAEQVSEAVQKAYKK